MRQDTLTGAAAAVAVAVILVLRASDIVTNPQLWAEDGIVFLTAALQHGWSSLFIPYAGYYLLVPRAIASFWTPIVDLENIPFAFNLSAVVAVAISSFFIATSRVPINHKWIYAILPALLCPTREVVGTITNLHWLCSLVLISVLFQTRASNWRHSFRDTSILAVFGLTGPFLLILSPFFAIRFIWLKANRFEWFLFLAVVIVTALTFGSVLGRVTGDNSGAMDMAKLALSLSQMAAGIFGSGGLISSSLLILVIVNSMRELPAYVTWATSTLIVYAALLFLASMRPLDSGLIEAISPSGAGGRYFVISIVLFGWILFFSSLRGNYLIRGVSTVLLLIVMIRSLNQIYWPPLEDFHWREQVVNIGNAPVVVTYPPGWQAAVCRHPCKLD